MFLSRQIPNLKSYFYTLNIQNFIISNSCLMNVIKNFMKLLSCRNLHVSRIFVKEINQSS